ncbi:MAG: CinA family protein [Proteobacteria bacterium]|nr:CinA family protein [Pseudomonadota bacterium]
MEAWQDHVVGAASLAAQLSSRRETLAVAESCTGGWVSLGLSLVPGVSGVFRGGVVAYAADMKIRQLGVDASLLSRHGVVSVAVAMAMASGVCLRCGSDWGLATTGYAGPGSGDEHFGVGWVCFAVYGRREQRAWARRFEGDRIQVMAGAAMEAWRGLREVLEKST